MIDSITQAALIAELEQHRSERVRKTRTIRASEEVLSDYAQKPLLSKAEAVAIIQGFTPPLGGFGDDCTYLEDYANEVQRFLSDVSRGVVPTPCRPRELVEWSVTAGVNLPAAFVRTIDGATLLSPVTHALREDANGQVPATAPEVRVLDSLGYDPEIQQHANAIANRIRQQTNRCPTKIKVTKELAKERAVEEKSIERRFRKEWDPRSQRSQQRMQAMQRRANAPRTSAKSST